MNYPTLRIKNKHQQRILGGHLWVFSNELIAVPKDIEPGSIVKLVQDKDNKPLGLAFYNPNSLICARIIARSPDQEITNDYIFGLISDAFNKRKYLFNERNAVRIVHGESDGLPGLIVEKYDNVITFQILSVGFEIRKEAIISILKDLFSPDSIIEKNRSHLRTLEGLEQIEEIVFGEKSAIEIYDGGGIRYNIDLIGGQKTGFYLDQMDNRFALRRYVPKGSLVLDLFSNHGGFGFHALRAGAEYVTAVDQSSSILSNLHHNANLNGLDQRIKTIETDGFEYMKSTKDMYDVIILDPPSLIRSKKQIKQAEHSYYALHRDALLHLNKDGIIATATCSHHFTREMFVEVIRRAGANTLRRVQILEERGAASDHPILVSMPETEYFKMFILQIS